MEQKDETEKIDFTIQEKFEKFHNKNPHVYDVLERFALEAKNKGKKKIGIDLLIQRARWEVIMNTETFDGFKINNSFSSRYVRLLIEKNPMLEDLFELRKIRTE